MGERRELCKRLGVEGAEQGSRRKGRGQRLRKGRGQRMENSPWVSRDFVDGSRGLRTGWPLCPCLSGRRKNRREPRAEM